MSIAAAVASVLATVGAEATQESSELVVEVAFDEAGWIGRKTDSEEDVAADATACTARRILPKALFVLLIRFVVPDATPRRMESRPSRRPTGPERVREPNPSVGETGSISAASRERERRRFLSGISPDGPRSEAMERPAGLPERESSFTTAIESAR